MGVIGGDGSVWRSDPWRQEIEECPNTFETGEYKYSVPAFFLKSTSTTPAPYHDLMLDPCTVSGCSYHN